MSLNGRGSSVHYTKKDLSTQKSIAVGFKKLKFYHQALVGDTNIDLLALSLPTSGIPAASTNPSAGDLAAAKLLLNKNNITLISSLSGILDFDSYTIPTNTRIDLGEAAEDGEIFIGIVDYVAKTGLKAVDVDPVVKTGTLLAAADEFIVGNPFDLNKYPTQQQGAVLVFLDGQLMARNTGNATAAPGADGDYQEIGSSGLATSIKFNITSVVDRSIMVVSNGLSFSAPSDSLIAQVENIAGQIDSLVPTVASLAGVPESTFQTAPNSVDLANFGNRMTTAEADIVAAEADLTALGEGGDASANGPLLATDAVAGAVKKNKSQTKVLATSVTNPTASLAIMTFNGLVIGRRYRLEGQLYQTAITTGNNSRLRLTQTQDNGNKPRFDVYPITGQEIQTPVNVEFTATATLVSIECYSGYTGVIAGVTSSENRTWLTLTELQSTEVTTDFT